MRHRFLIYLGTLVAAVTSGSTALAGTILDCGPLGALCAVTLSIDGKQVASGNFQIDSTTGDLIWPEVLSGSSGESTVEVTNVFGNADPILGYATSASTGGVGGAFSITFSLPIALSGPIDAEAQVSYSLTGTTAPGAQISPLFGNVALAREVDTSVGGLPRSTRASTWEIPSSARPVRATALQAPTRRRTSSSETSPTT